MNNMDISAKEIAKLSTYYLDLLYKYDFLTAVHSVKVNKIAMALAMRAGLSPPLIRTVSAAALLHDIGKLKIPQQILNKPLRLSDSEFEIIKRHPVYGYQMLSASSSFTLIAQAVHYHHEHYAGTGYPDGIKGQDIPLVARIITIADVYDAMTCDRVYRQALPKEIALQFIEERKGRQFDPWLVKIFMSIQGIDNHEFL